MERMNEEISKEELRKLLILCERKLEELMTKKEYQNFIREVAIKTFLMRVEEMEDGDFKDFCMENFDLITNR